MDLLTRIEQYDKIYIWWSPSKLRCKKKHIAMSMMIRTYRRKAYMYGNTCSIRWIITRSIYLFLREYKMVGSTGGGGAEDEGKSLEISEIYYRLRSCENWVLLMNRICSRTYSLLSMSLLSFCILHTRAHVCACACAHVYLILNRNCHFDRLSLIFTFCFHRDSFVIKIFFFDSIHLVKYYAKKMVSRNRYLIEIFVSFILFIIDNNRQHYDTRQ